MVIFELDGLHIFLAGKETVSLASFVLHSDHQKQKPLTMLVPDDTTD